MGQLQKFLKMNECRISLFYILNSLNIVDEDDIRKILIDHDAMRRILDRNDIYYRGDKDGY